MMQIGENLSSHSKRNLPAKIRIISQSLFSIPSDLISAIPKQEFRCLSSMSNNTILSMWPSHSVKYVFHLSLINSQRTSDGSPIFSSLTQQSIDSLIPSPNSFPAAFFFISNNEILEYSILEGKTSTLSSSATESSLYLNLDVRPRSGGNPIDILVSKESKGSKSLQLIRKKGDDVINKIYPGIAGVILGEENAIGENLIIVAEDRSTVSLFYLDDEEFMTFSLNMKIKNAYWTPLQYGFSVLYETLHEHSLRLSKSVRTGRTEDVDLSEKDVYKLDYDEILTCLKWHTINNKLALGTSKRIIILDSDLQMIEQCNLERPRWSVPSSVY